ncbi:uncharacterized protein LOC102706362 [Oryza brachyantha]|nr:uncharacterized protein LOC102706362 [Oryza brachyantha]
MPPEKIWSGEAAALALACISGTPEGSPSLAKSQTFYSFLLLLLTKPSDFPQIHRVAMAAARLLLLVAAVALLAAVSPAAAGRPCGHAQTLLISFSSVSRPNPDPTNPTPVTTTVVTVLRVRRLGPHQPLQIRRPDPLPAASDAASSVQDRAKDILVVVSGLLFGFGCGALTAATMYLVWSLVASTCAPSYEQVYGEDEDDELSDSESPKKAGYVIIHDAEQYVGGKN